MSTGVNAVVLAVVISEEPGATMTGDAGGLQLLYTVILLLHTLLVSSLFLVVFGRDIVDIVLATDFVMLAWPKGSGQLITPYLCPEDQ